MDIETRNDGNSAGLDIATFDLNVTDVAFPSSPQAVWSNAGNYGRREIKIQNLSATQAVTLKMVKHTTPGDADGTPFRASEDDSSEETEIAAASSDTTVTNTLYTSLDLYFKAAAAANVRIFLIGRA